MMHILTMLAFGLHIGGGTVGLVFGIVAAFAAKGGRLHRTAGNVFFVSMMTMAAAAAYLGVVVPDYLNIFIAAFTAYLIGTAWLTARRRPGATGAAEKILFGVALVLCAPFAVLSFQLALGLPPLLKSTVALQGPVLIAIYAFTAVLLIAAAGDAKVVSAGGIAGVPRIARHLWRMCLGLTLATGSAFTNGVSRLLPGPHHVPAILFLPQFVPLILLVFWMIRVQFAPWRKPAIAAQA
jgi:uncharacterized membrane protein